MTPIEVVVHVEAVSEANVREHWGARHRRHQLQRVQTRLALLSTGARPGAILLPVDVTFVRVGKRLLDTDNLAGSMKSIRDDVADFLGVDDGPTEKRVSWGYEQRTGTPSVVVRITARRP
jgi:hypothetical protein